MQIPAAEKQFRAGSKIRERGRMSTLDELFTMRKEQIEKINGLARIAREKQIWPYNQKFASREYLDLVSDEVRKFNGTMAELFRRELALSGPEHFSRENVWVWGGPTPSWGGSMAKDAGLKAREYFGFDNVMYVYGALDREMVELHRECGKLICHLGSNCRTKGVRSIGDVEEAETLSSLSLEFPNLRGGVVDDMIANCGPNYSIREYRKIYDALHRHNPDLELYAVVYTYELDLPIAKRLSDCIDRVILWTWSAGDLIQLDMNLEKCRLLYPGKKIMMGVFMFDYGLTALPNQVAAMEFQLSRARRYLSEGKIQDIVILGDREIEKCPDAAEYIRKFFRDEFSWEK